MKKLVFALLLGATLNCAASSIHFVRNDNSSIDYGRQVRLPSQFGQAEFTLELWVKPNHLLPVGPTVTDPEKRTNWAAADNRPYSSYGWWYTGNFLLDGFNNGNFSAGTFALQFYGGGRVRWLLGDGSSQTGGVRAVGAYPASSTPHLLDGRWHQLTLVRRWSGTSAAQLELWIDGVLIDTEAGSRTNMRQWWDNWYGFSSDQAGWFWGAEKQAAIGTFVYEDYRGLIDELRFWSRAKSSSEIQANWNKPVMGTDTGLVGWYAFGETGGSSVCDTVGGACMSLHRTTAATFSAEEAPLETSANGGTLAFSPSAYSATENAGVVTISVVRSGGAAGAASVSYATGGGSALANADYRARVRRADMGRRPGRRSHLPGSDARRPAIGERGDDRCRSVVRCGRSSAEPDSRDDHDPGARRSSAHASSTGAAAERRLERQFQPRRRRVSRKRMDREVSCRIFDRRTRSAQSGYEQRLARQPRLSSFE